MYSSENNPIINVVNKKGFSGKIPNHAEAIPFPTSYQLRPNS